MSPLNRRRPLVVALVVGGVALVVAGLVLWLTPLGPGPGLPPGATRLTIDTQPPHVVPTLGCRAALLLPARVATDGDELILMTVDTGEPVRVVWPAGWAAWRLDGRAVLVGRHGEIVAREGDVLDDLGGGGEPDGAFEVCVIGS